MSLPITLDLSEAVRCEGECQLLKHPTNDFHVDKKAKTGRKKVCKDCYNKRNRENYHYKNHIKQLKEEKQNL